MHFEEALKNELNNVSGLSGKVFPLNVIEGIKAPFLVYQSSDGIMEKTLSGFVVSTEIIGNMYIVHTSYTSMKDMSNAVISALQGFQGRVIGGTGGVRVYDVTYERVHESYDPQLFYYQCELEFKVRI